MKTDIQHVRTFNRTVAQRLGMLSEKYLGRDRPYVESRVLYEIGIDGSTVRDLRTRLGLDSGFLSRLLRRLERKGLAVTRPCAADRRVRRVQLSRSGKTELRRLNAGADKLAQTMLQPLSKSQVQRLVASMTQVECLLRASSVEIAPADASDPAARTCLKRYFAELDARFRNGFDPARGGPADDDEYAPPHGRFVIARLFDKPIGCAALRTLRPGIGEIKRMWISPEARRLGIGRRLLAELECLAKRHRMRKIRLDTNATLKEALRLYRSTGYREIPRFNDNPYAQHWFEKRL